VRVLNILPLDCFPVSLIKVLELVLNIGFPGNVGGVDRYRLTTLLVKCEGIIEKALSDETARESWLVHDQVRIVDGLFTAQVFVALDGIAVVELVNFKPVAHELRIGSRLDVATMVLVEIIKLIVYVDGRLDIALYR
jgi:hypothetical protein